MSSAYLRTTRDAVAAIEGAELEDLAGGCYGVAVKLENGWTLTLARCPDLGCHVAYATWTAQVTDLEGELVWPSHSDQWHSLGYVRPRDYAEMLPAALRMFARAMRGAA